MPNQINFHKACHIPFAIHSKVDAELGRLMEQKIIEPISFSDWAAPIVLILKSDKSSIRIWGYFKVTVNNVSQLDRYPIPRIEELLPNYLTIDVVAWIRFRCGKESQRLLYLSSQLFVSSSCTLEVAD